MNYGLLCMYTVMKLVLKCLTKGTIMLRDQADQAEAGLIIN